MWAPKTMLDPVISLLIQVPLVGVFIWFALQLTKNAQTSQDKRDAEWRQFLIEERKARSDSTGRLAEEIKEATKLLGQMQALMISHDTRVQAAIPVMQKAIDREREKSRPRKDLE